MNGSLFVRVETSCAESTKVESKNIHVEQDVTLDSV